MHNYNTLLDAHIGSRVKERRKAMRLSQADLAALLNITPQQIQRYEAGENSVSAARLFELGQILNASIDYFYKEAPANTIGNQSKKSSLINRQTTPLSLLLIDDNPHEAMLFQQALGKCSQKTNLIIISDATEVMPKLKQLQKTSTQPNIILLDINMPRINGLDLLQQIKLDSATALIPVIMLTNSTRLVEMERAYSLHANGFIQKSTDLQEFFNDVRKIVDYWSSTCIAP